MRLIICGGRMYRHRSKFFEVMEEFVKDFGRPSLVIHGAALGADTLAEQWATASLIPTQPMPAQWEIYGKGAGHVRNKEMICEKPDMVLAFPGGPGTEGMIELANRFKVPVIKIPI
jgi:predicted Rossmann-fold nucleotide-binding protein